MIHSLVVHLDGLGDMLVCGPAIRAVAASSDRTTVLAGPHGAEAAWLLPGVDDVLVWSCPWILADPPSVTPSDIRAVVERLSTIKVDRALILTSFHQSALPTAMLLRLAGAGYIAAVSEHYPGQLLDMRLSPPGQAPEPQRMLSIALAAGYQLPPGDDGRLAIRQDLCKTAQIPPGRYVVVHPSVRAPARAYPISAWCAVVQRLTMEGWSVLVTGSAWDREATARVAAAAWPPGKAIDCGGRFDLPALAAALRSADAVLVANTGTAHLAAAVGNAGCVVVRAGGRRGDLVAVRGPTCGTRQSERAVSRYSCPCLPGRGTSLLDNGLAHGRDQRNAEPAPQRPERARIRILLSSGFDSNA